MNNNVLQLPAPHNHAEMLKVFASPLPFSNRQITAYSCAGDTLENIVGLLLPVPIRDVGAVAIINGNIIPEDEWADTIPQITDNVVVNIVPMGGGKKSPIGLLLSIVVAIAAPYAGAAIAASISAATNITLATSLVLGKALTIGIGIVGKLLISALAPPPKPSNTGSTNNPAESPTLFVEGARNTFNPFGVVPVCLGTNRMIPPQCARPYSETKNNDQFIRQLFSWGYGQKLAISDFKIGESDVADFEEIQFEHRLSGNLSSGTKLFPRDVFQDDFNILLEEVGGYTLRTTPLDVDEAIVDVTFFQGLTKFNEKGKKVQQTVQLELQYSPAGLNQWSPAAVTYKNYSGDTLTVADVEIGSHNRINDAGTTYYQGYRKDLVVVDIYTGDISIVSGNSRRWGNYDNSQESSAYAPTLPPNKIRLSTLTVRTRENYNNGAKTTVITNYTDDRSSYIGKQLEDSGDFDVTASGDDVTIAAGAIKTDELNIKAAQTEALRRSVRVIFPTSGQYDLRIKRITADTSSDRILDKVTLTAIKSFKYEPPVLQTGVNGTAVRVKATDQLNGPLEQFNAIVSNVIPDYNPNTDTWTARVTSNPASIYRYILQGAANSRPLADSKIDLDALGDWHQHCDEQNYTYDRVIDYETSVEEILRDVAAAGAASPAIVDGRRTIVIDRIKDDIVQIVTPRNSWSYSAELTYPELPHAFRVQFRNAEKGYQQDEVIVYDDGYNAGNATIFEGLELQSCTSAGLAFKTARRHIASARLRPEVHSWMMDIENLVALRGNRVKLAHDVPLVGIGYGRITTITTDGNSPEMVTGFSIDDVVTVPSDATFYVRIRKENNEMLYKQVNTTIGEMTSFTFTDPFTVDDIPKKGDLAYFVEAGGELDLVITKIEPQADLTARITAINYAPEIFTAESAVIPPFESNVTTPLEFIRPSPPVLKSDPQTGESVMLLNSDGSITTRAIFSLENINDGDITTIVKIRESGSTDFNNANVLEATPERLVLTGLEDGTYYDVQIRYQRKNSGAISLPLVINSMKYIGASEVPDDVTGFMITINGENMLLEWDKSQEIDFDHFVIKYSAVFTGAAWNTAQIIKAEVYENRISLPFLPGTYLVKQVDRTDNESVNATAIITYDPLLLRNVVEELTEEPTFSGAKDNTAINGGYLTLGDASTNGYYYFANGVDLGGIYTSFVSSAIVANGVFLNNMFEMDDMMTESDLFGSGDNDLMIDPDWFLNPDLFGIGADAWDVQLQYRITLSDPTDSPAGWGAWQEFVAGNIEFWAIEFRLLLRTYAENISPAVSRLYVKVDMPDRIERGEDINIDPLTFESTIVYPQPFKNNPAVAISIQNGATDDRVEFVAKTSSGFTIKIFNATAGTYVVRSYDYISSGYGRLNI